MRERRHVGERNSNNHKNMKNKQLPYFPQSSLVCLWVRLCSHVRRAKQWSILQHPWPFFFAGVEPAVGTYRKFSKHVLLMRRCSEWSHGSQQCVSSNPQRRAAIPAGRTLRCLRLELTLDGERALETQMQCAAVCVLAAPGCKCCASDFHISNQVCAFGR